MRKTYLACLGALLLAAPASAGHAGYSGGCTLSAQWVSGTTWAGSVAIAAVASPTGAAISMECVLHVNGVWRDVLLDESGTGAVADATLVTFTADELDTVWVCEVAVVDGEDFVDCHP